MHRGSFLASPRPLARYFLLRLASAPSPLSLARSLCVLAAVPFPLSGGFSRHLMLSSCAFSAHFFRRPLWALTFLTAAGVGPRRQWFAAVSEFVGSSCQRVALRGSLSPFPFARSVAPLFRAHPLSLPARSIYSSILLVYTFLQSGRPRPLVPGPPVPAKRSFS